MVAARKDFVTKSAMDLGVLQQRVPFCLALQQCRVVRMALLEN
jgi:hypothetical protein